MLCAGTLALLHTLARADALPPAVEAALRRAQVPIESMAVVVQEAGGGGRALLTHQAQALMNPASLTKLWTTAAALDTLGPAWTWATPVWIQGNLRDGVLEGTLTIKGTGDPKLVVERMWLMLRRVQQWGVREIRGDIVLDRSAFSAAEAGPADFDGEALRPYNVRADALMLNYKAVVYTFTPDAERGVAWVQVDPPMAGQRVDSQVSLSKGPCEDWRGALKANFSDRTRVRFAGTYPAACGEQAWPLADADGATYNARMVEGLWREMGGRLTGTVREGFAPTDAKPSFELKSPPLLEAVREINKFSNNVMAQQLFLTLALVRNPGQPATPELARDTLRKWWADRIGELPNGVALDNGSGLSRATRMQAQGLARVLQVGYASPWMSELMSSLPVSGVDGTLGRSKSAVGRAHLKTGSLRDVAGVAGYVLSESGRHLVVVAIINHANANAARPALDAVVQWAARDGAAAR